MEGTVDEPGAPAAASPGGAAASPTVEVPFPHVARWGRAAAVCCALMAALMLFVYDHLRDDLYTLGFVRAGLPVSRTEIALNHARLEGVAVTAALLAVAGATSWLVWQYRAHANLAALQVQGLRFRPAVAVVSWLVPAAALVLPVAAVRELWRASDPYAEGTAWRKARTNPLVWLWWLGFVAAAASVARGLLFDLGPTTPDELIARDHAFQIAAIITVPTGVVAAILIALIDGRLSLAEDRSRFPGWRQWSRA